MIKNILNDSTILQELFTESDFNFLKQNNDKQEELEKKINFITLNRYVLQNYINKFENKNEYKENLNEAQRCLKYVDELVEDLVKMINQFDSIEKNILELIAQKEKNREFFVTTILSKIDNQIQDFKDNEIIIDSKLQKYNTYIDKFLRDVIDVDNIDIKNSPNTTSIESEEPVLQESDIDNKIIVKDNLELKISEKDKKIYLPYTKEEIYGFLENYPNEYKNEEDVINQEFITEFSLYNNHPVLARFREAYSLCKNREMKSAIDSLKFAMHIMFRSDINPAIIAAVKSQKQLEAYIECVEKNNLDDFKYFKITYEVTPF